MFKLEVKRCEKCKNVLHVEVDSILKVVFDYDEERKTYIPCLYMKCRYKSETDKNEVEFPSFDRVLLESCYYFCTHCGQNERDDN